MGRGANGWADGGYCVIDDDVFVVYVCGSEVTTWLLVDVVRLSGRLMKEMQHH